MMKPLPASEHDAILSTGLAVLVFSVAESPACRDFRSELEEFVARHPAQPVWTVEAMAQRQLSERHGLRALPTIVIYRDGLPARRFAGSMSAAQLAASVSEVARADMEVEIEDWIGEMAESGEAGSPYLNAG